MLSDPIDQSSARKEAVMYAVLDRLSALLLLPICRDRRSVRGVLGAPLSSDGTLSPALRPAAGRTVGR